MNCVQKFIIFIAVAATINCQAEDEAFNQAVDAYIYGYPLVLMDVTKQISTNVAAPDNYHAPINQFAHAREMATPSFRLFPSPNVDTLSSLAWLDLSKGAFVLHLPTIPERYFVIELIDGWSNVITSLGPRTTGSNAQDFLITGPGFNDEIPENMTQIPSTTNMLWIVARTQCYGPQDVSTVGLIQNQYTLTPLASYGQNYTPPRNMPVDSNIDTKTAPEEQVAGLVAETFFKRLAKLMQANPPSPQDAPMLAKVATLGIVPGIEPAFSEGTRRMLSKVPTAARARMTSKIANAPTVMTGWSTPLIQVGQYGTDYLLRASIASFNLGANLPQDILLAISDVDVNGSKLDGSSHYRIHVDASLVPPVNAFWSLTMYNADHYLVPNDLKRYVLHSFTTLAYDTLQYNDDGSLDIILQKDKPNILVSNWLPTPSGSFNLVFRMYWPQKPALSGAYIPPPITPIENVKNS